MAETNFAATPEEEAIIKRRFLTQVTISRGVPPLKDLARKYLLFCNALGSGQPAKIAELRDNLLSSLMATQASGERQRVSVEANLREQEAYAVRRVALQADIEQAHQDIASRREQLKAAQIQKQRNEEYEALRRSIMKFPKRMVSLSNTNAVNAESEAIEAEGITIGHTIDQRRSDMLALLKSIDVLTASIEAEGSGGVTPMET